jgi:dihydroflavonol-4-reductase
VTRVFLTGGSGLVGGALARRLIERGAEVVALARSDAAERALTARGARVVRGDTLDEDAMAAGMEGCELAFHVAGVNTFCPPDPAALFHVNVRGAEAAVRAAGRSGVARVVLTSSASSLGEERGTVGSEASPHRGRYHSTYERSKHEGELAAFAAAGRCGVDLVAVNPSSVQGPGRAGGTGRILIAYLNGRLRAFVDTRMSLVDIEDCVAGHLLAAERGVAGERYVLSGATLSSRDAVELVSELSGVRHRVRVLPPFAAIVAGAAVEGVFRVRGKKPPFCREMVATMLHGHRYDGSRAERELGLHYTPVAVTFRRTIEWARAEGLVPAA